MAGEFEFHNDCAFKLHQIAKRMIHHREPRAAQPQPKKIGRKERKGHKRDVGATDWSPFGPATQKFCAGRANFEL